MTDGAENNGRFRRGNPGRPKGARNKATVAAELLLDGDAETITAKAIELAKAGDAAMIRLCMDRFCPPRKDRLIPFELPKLDKVTDASAAMAAIVDAVAAGDLTPTEAAELSKLVDGFARVAVAIDFEARLERLEKGPAK